MYKVVGRLGKETICKEFKRKKDAIAFVRRTDSMKCLHIRKPNGDWITPCDIWRKK